MSDLPSQIGPYTILDTLGSGGMGSVYLGRQLTTGEMAAVKVLPASMAQEAGFVERFAREIDSMKRLSNPHIVKLYDSGVDNGTYFYSMEYVPGETLTSLVRRVKRLPWEQVVDIGVQVCRALKAAHDQGIVHRDLKPSNLLITPDGVVKLTDFGVAQVFATDRLTVTGGIVGTAEFMSPEQAEGKRATKQSDLYSLGAVLYALVTGRPPFSGNTAIDVLQKHKFGRFDPPRLLVPEIPHWFDELICQLLEKDPAKRLPDALVLARRLEQVLKKVELAEGDTTAAAPAASSNTTVAAGADHGGGVGPATLMKHLVRAELENQARRTPLQELLNNTWVLVGLLALLILGGVLWFQSGTLSAEEQFAAGAALMEQPEGDAWLEARDKYFSPLLRDHEEAWSEQVAPYLRKIELYDLKRKLGGKRVRRAPVAAESEPERFLALAQAQRQSGDFAQALATLTALNALLAGDPERGALYDLTNKLLEEWHGDEDARKRRDDWLAESLARADKLARDGHRAAAEDIWSSIVQLYGHDPGAAKQVASARAGLAKSKQ